MHWNKRERGREGGRERERENKSENEKRGDVAAVGEEEKETNLHL